ncbi:MAG TPA: acyltransferase [Polyangiaceae bacterium]|nr:acyltransferase [Polyangiaceae bacterium]
MLKPVPSLVAHPTTEIDGSQKLAVLDGVRGVAIIMVMILHFLHGAVANNLLGEVLLTICGWGVTGVDLFFVLSGFLITRILFRTRLEPHYFRNFYARRTLRIFPLYYAYLILYFGIVTRFTNIDRARSIEVSSYQGWVWLYATNILICLRGNYIVASVNHLWSLAVEEHFYLVWPALVRFFEVRRMLAVCAAAFVIAIACRALFSWLNLPWFAANVFTLCRVDSLAAGAALAVFERTYSGETIARGARRLFWISLGVLAIWGLALGRYPFGQVLKEMLGPSVVALLFASVIALAVWGPARSLARRLFMPRFLCWIATYAYGLYVLHQPIRILMQRTLPFERLGQYLNSYLLGLLLHGAITGALSIAFAFLSYHCFEKHLLKLKRFFEQDRGHVSA